MAGDGGALDTTTLQHFMEGSIDILCVMDTATKPIALSRSWEDLLGWSREELMARPLIEIVHPDDLDLVASELRMVLEGGTTKGTELRLQHRSGDWVWVQGGASADLETGHIFVTAVDLRSRKGLEEALREQVRLEEIVASIASGLIGTSRADLPDAIKAALGQLATGLGAHRGHFLRGSRDLRHVVYLEWYDPDLPQAVHRPSADVAVRTWWTDALRSGRTLRFDDVEELRAEAPEVVDALLADGVRSLLHIPLQPHRQMFGFLTFSAVVEPVAFSDAAVALVRLAGECFMTALAASDDAAALEDARRELEQRNEELERSNEELERFAYSAAHDLKAPLARVEMALSAAPTAPGPVSDLLDIARRGASRMRQLIEDLLAFAAVGRAREEAVDVDLEEVLGQVLQDLDPVLAGAGVELRRPSRLPVVRGSRALLGQLLQNLVGNAVKFLRPDGSPVLSIAAVEEDGGARITVADNGIGIAPEDRAKVFGVFTRLNPDDAFQGSGVGLATCARVVQHHGGRIWIDDGIDGGVAVHVWLPGEPSAPGAVTLESPFTDPGRPTRPPSPDHHDRHAVLGVQRSEELEHVAVEGQDPRGS